MSVQRFFLCLGLLALMPTCADALIVRSTASYPVQPAAANSWGYNNLTFFDDFDDLSSIDVNNTLQPGFKWYAQDVPFNIPGSANPPRVQLANAFSVTNSVLHFVPTVPGYMVQMGFRGNSNPGFVGTGIAATTKGGYFEARLAYNPACGGTKYAAWWAFDPQLQLAHSQYISISGTYPEIDFLENIAGPTGWQGQIHDWYSPYSDFGTGTSGTGFATPPGTAFHKYGFLWITQAKNGGTGFFQWYYDGVAVGNAVPYSSSTISSKCVSGSGVCQTGAFSETETLNGFNMKIGNSANCYIDVDYVMVWQ